LSAYKPFASARETSSSPCLAFDSGVWNTPSVRKDRASVAKPSPSPRKMLSSAAAQAPKGRFFTVSINSGSQEGFDDENDAARIETDTA